MKRISYVFLLMILTETDGLLLPDTSTSEDLGLLSKINVMNITMQALVTKVNQLEKKVAMAPIAFLAELGATITDPPVGSHVVFDVIHLNDGNAYSKVHGVFTAPVAGVYHFTLELSGPSGDASHQLHINLMKSSSAVGFVFLDQNTDHWIKRTSTTTLHLKAGDDVWVKVSSKVGVGQIAAGGYRSSFSGFLIKAD